MINRKPINAIFIITGSYIILSILFIVGLFLIVGYIPMGPGDPEGEYPLSIIFFKVFGGLFGLSCVVLTIGHLFVYMFPEIKKRSIETLLK